MKRGGAFVAVVGPSGSGKDSLLSTAAARFRNDPAILFVQRFITREADPDHEDHHSVSRQAFLDIVGRGGFALSWEAHGLMYGIPASVYDHVASSGVAVANLSRAAVAGAKTRFVNCHVVAISAKPDIRAQRLAGRGRESAAQILARLEREQNRTVDLRADYIIENNDLLEVAANRFIELLEDIARQPARVPLPGESNSEAG